MNIADVQFPVFNPYNKATVEIYISGCTRKCNGCHNAVLADYNYGKQLDNSLYDYLKTRVEFFDILSITGGDLLCQDSDKAKEFAEKLRKMFPNKEMWLFTGENNFDNIPIWCKEVFDVIKWGSYKEELKALGTNNLLATTNQKIWRKNER